MKKILVILLLVFSTAIGYCTQPQNIGYSSTDNPFQLFSQTKVQLGTITPDAVGQIAYCNNCTQVPVCVSTASTRGSWASVAVSTQATFGFGLCQ